MADDLPSKGRKVTKHISQGPAYGVIAAERLGFHNFQDTNEWDRCEESGTDTNIDVCGVLPLSECRLLLSKREERPDR